MLKDLQSISSSTNGTVLKSGTCLLEGMTFVSITFAYKKLSIGGLDYFYYVFDESPSSIQINNTGFKITSCSPILYSGPPGEISPIFLKQIESFSGDGASELSGLRAGSNELGFTTTPFIGTKQLGISLKKLTHFVSFF